MKPGFFPFLNSGILAYLPVAVDIPGEGLTASMPQHPSSIVLREFTLADGADRSRPCS